MEEAKTVQYNVQLDKLCDILCLGKIIKPPEPVSGGLLHRMFSVETPTGRYAVKALNPSIMLRPNVLRAYIDSESVACIASKKIPAVSAKIFDSSSVQKIDGQYYLVYDWIDGRSLTHNEINTNNCKKMGSVLAALHSIDFSELNLTEDYSFVEEKVDWEFYLKEGLRQNSIWVGLMQENLHNLYKWNDLLVEAAEKLGNSTVISHGDLEPKNVLWCGDDPIIIDWEAAGFVNPDYDLFETAVYWSKNGAGSIDKLKFQSFITAYINSGKEIKSDYNAIMNKGYVNKLGWLEYSLKHSLQIERTDESGQRAGTEQVTGTINELLIYEKMIPQLYEWLSNV